MDTSEMKVELTTTSPVLSTAMDAAVAAAAAAASATAATHVPASLGVAQTSHVLGAPVEVSGLGTGVESGNTAELIEASAMSHQGNDEPPPPPPPPPPPMGQGRTNDVSAVLAEEEDSKKKKRTQKSAPVALNNANRGGELPKRPKRPRTAYHFFYDTRRIEELRKDPKRENNELSKVLAEEWKALEDRSHYERLAEAAKIEYETACREYEVATGHLMSDCLPKKPPTAYMIFFRAQHVPNVDKQVDDFSKVVGALWKGMTDEGRKVYHDQAADLKFKYEKACSLLTKSKQDMVGQSFIDLLHGDRSATVQEYNLEKDLYTVVYEPSSDPLVAASSSHKPADETTIPPLVSTEPRNDIVTLGGSTHSAAAVSEALAAPESTTTPPPPPNSQLTSGLPQSPALITLAEIRARICGDEKAIKRATKPAATAKKTSHKAKRAPAAATTESPDEIQHSPPPPPPPPANLGLEESDNDTNKKKRTFDEASGGIPDDAPWLHITKDEALLPEEQMVNVIRLCRRLIGGACIQNLRKMCATLGLPISGSKGLLGTRLELYLRHYDFKTYDFKPTAEDVENLNIEAFNVKYDKDDPLKIDDIVVVLEDIMTRNGTTLPESKKIKLDDPLLNSAMEEDDDLVVPPTHDVDVSDVLPNVGDIVPPE